MLECTTSWPAAVAAGFAAAKADLAAGRLTPGALDALLVRVLEGPGALRQRLLYLHASMPGLHAAVVAAAIHEPAPGAMTQIDPLAPEVPYDTVAAAIADGWRVVHFPDQRAPFDDREIDVVGYEFILEKLEPLGDPDA